MIGLQTQCTSHEGGRTTLRPNAPALAQEQASSLILAKSVSREGVSLSKTQLFLCFQTIKGTRSATDCRALHCSCSVLPLAWIHQSMSVGSWLGIGVGMRSQASVSCHACRVKGQSNNKCRIVSGA